MQITPTANLDFLYTEGKFWIGVGTIMWSVFKAAKWVKEIREVDLANIKSSLDAQAREVARRTEVADIHAKEQTAQIVHGFKENTSSIVREISEMRADFRAFYSTQPKRTSKPRSSRKTRAARAGN